MSAIKLVVTDIDATLVRERTHEPTAVVRETLEAVQATGVTVAAATARPYEMTAELFADIGLQGPSVFDGGASVRDIKTGELLWQNWLDVERVQAVVKLFLPHSEIIDFFPGYNVVPSNETSLAEANQAAPYVWGLVDRTAFEAMKSELSKIPNLAVHPGNGWPEKPHLVDVQVTDIGSDKFHAVNALREFLGLTKEQTLAIGDAGNDLPLFESASIRVAMGNAIPELKALADHIVASVEEDGWAEAMNRFVLA